MGKDIPKKETKFDVEDFYRKLGVWLLVLLLFIITIFGSIMLSIQNEILRQTNPKFSEKGSVQVIYTDDIEEATDLTE